MADFYWMGATDSLASKFQNWSASAGGAPLGAWPGGSPGAADNFYFDDASSVNCTWESSVVSMANARLISQSLTAPYTGIITFNINVNLQGLILNAQIDGSMKLVFTGSTLTELQDADNRDRYILNGQFANPSTNLEYHITPTAGGVHIDNGPYPKVQFIGIALRSQYNIPTATTHDYADDATIHIKGSCTFGLGSGLTTSALDMALDTLVKIKFDTTVLSIACDTLDFGMATTFFRGLELPVTGSQTYGTIADGFTAKHYAIVIFASTPGETTVIRNGLALNCYSLEVKAGAIFRASNQGYNTSQPALINSQTEPIIRGVWAFSSSANHSFVSPKSQYVANVPSGGTGRNEVKPGSLLIGNASSAHSPLDALLPGTNGYVLTMTSGTPQWQPGGGGGGGGMTSWSIGSTTGTNQTVSDGEVVDVVGGTCISGTIGGTRTVTLDLDDTAVTAATYGSATQSPVIAIDAQGRITSASNANIPITINTDEKVKINALDSAAGYLENKIVAGTGLNTSLAVVAPFGTQLSLNNESLAFKTIVVAGQTDVVADGIADTLTLVAGANMTLTTNAAADSITFASTGGGGGGGVSVEDGGVPLGVATTLNFDTNLTASLVGSTAIISAAGGGGGGGYPLFRHDQAPTTNNFSPFRLLVNGETIELGAAGSAHGQPTDNKNVSVFTPITDEEDFVMIGIKAIGNVATNTGREYIFYGPGRRAADATAYATLPLSTTGGYPTYFVESMRDVPVGSGIFFGATLMQVFPSDGVNNVRVIDAGEHQVLNGSQVGGTEEPEEASTVRILLLADHQLIDNRGRFAPNYRLRSSP